MSRALLTVHDLAYSTSVATIFSKLSVTVSAGARIGLIGRNGVGKTTFLQLLASKLELDSGTITIDGVVGYVPQVPDSHLKEVTIGDLLGQEAYLHGQYDQLYAKIFNAPALTKDIQIKDLSGGEYTKAYITFSVMSNPDVLLLDEPTNHLDTKGIESLQNWLYQFPGAVICVSHNRAFLENAAKIIWEISENTINVFTGTYSESIIQKGYEAEAKERKYESVKKELNVLEKGVSMREVRVARAAKASKRSKSDASRDKMADGYTANRSEKGAGRLKKQQDSERVRLGNTLDDLRAVQTTSVSIPLDGRSGGKKMIFDVKNITVLIGERTLVTDVSIRVEYGDRVAITGDNGAGKTVLVKRLLEEVMAPSMQSNGEDGAIEMQYIDQRYDIVDESLTLFENLESVVATTNNERIYKQLARFKFPEHYMHRKPTELSGGELARLAFAMVTTSPIDLLVLDEPTNNLDVDTVDVILEALQDFTGAIVVISHDQFFLDSLKIERMYAIEQKSFFIC